MRLWYRKKAVLIRVAYCNKGGRIGQRKGGKRLLFYSNILKINL